MRPSSTRQQVEDAIDRLILLLDAIDGDSESEPEETDCDIAGASSDAEMDDADHGPSLGWSEGMAEGPGRWGGSDDREGATEPILTYPDREISYGAPSHHRFA